MNLACILLAAGSGRRFGGDKMLYTVDGEPMIVRALRLHAAAPYAARLLVVRPDDAPIGAYGTQYGFSVVPNPAHESGIASSVCAGMAALAAVCPAADGVLFGVCDQPYLRQATLTALTDAFCSDASRIVLPVCGGKRGNPVLFPRSTFTELSALTGDRGGSAVVARRPELLRLLDVADAAELRDIDYRNGEST